MLKKIRAIKGKMPEMNALDFSGLYIYTVQVEDLDRIHEIAARIAENSPDLKTEADELKAIADRIRNLYDDGEQDP